MAPTSQQRAAATAVPSPRALCESLVGIVTQHANEHLTAVLTRMVGAMLDVSDPALDAREVYQRVKSGNLLKNNTYAFLHLASAALERALHKEMALLLPAPGKLARDPAQTLSLVPFEEMDRSVAFGGISRPFESAYAEPLATLNVRLGFLLERDILRIGQNPFRPEVFLMALAQAWGEFEPDAEAHDLLLPLLTPAILFDFAPMFEALNLALTRKGGLPGSADSMRIRKTDNAAKAQAARAASQAALAQQLRQFLAGGEPGTGAAPGPALAAAPAAALAAALADIPLIPDLPLMPQGSGGWRPSGAQAFGSGTAVTAASGASPARPARAGAGFQNAAQPGGAGPAATLAAAGLDGPDGSYPGALPAAAAQPAPPAGPPTQLLEFLAQLQLSLPPQPAGAAQPVAGPLAPNVFYLPRLKQSLPQGSLSRGDESTIDLLTRIFETVELDDNIPAETRALIQFLQIPVLKAALLDKNFFFEEAHPARRMIDLMSRMGWEQRSGPDDPLFQAMQRSVDRVGRDVGQEAGVFADAVAELEASMAAEEGVAAAGISAPIASALKQEKVTAATRSAKSAVALRLGSGDLLAVVETFLENKWTSVLTVAYSVEEDKPGAVNNATRTMDELIWSVKPKITQEQRKALIAKLPGMLATLNKWLDIIKWQDADRLQFFAELAECHASIVRAPLELSPERQLEIALEVAQRDALRRIEKEQAAAALEEAAVDQAVLSVDGLERGMWLAFTQPDRTVRQVKLAWISPLRTLFIFSTAARQEAFSISSEKLAQAFRDETVRVTRQEGVVARALSAAMGLGAPGNDSSIDPLRAAG